LGVAPAGAGIYLGFEARLCLSRVLSNTLDEPRKTFDGKSFIKLAAAVNRSKSHFVKKQLVFFGGFHRGGISRIEKQIRMPLPKRAMALLKTRRL